MGRPLRFWFIKNNERPFENDLDIIRELMNDVGSKDYHLKGIEVLAPCGDNKIHNELTGKTAGKLRGIFLGNDPDTLTPAFAPRPDISAVVQFRDYAIPAMNIPNPLPQESLMELTARLSHKVGEIMLVNADEDVDGYMTFENGSISFYGFKFTDEFITRFYGGKYKIDMYAVHPSFEKQRVGSERISEAADRSGMKPIEIEEHEEEMIVPFWNVAIEGINLFYKLKLSNICTWETNIATLEKVSDPGVGLYDVYPDGVGYSYPDEPVEVEKKPWWKVW